MSNGFREPFDLVPVELDARCKDQVIVAYLFPFFCDHDILFWLEFRHSVLYPLYPFRDN